MNNLNEYINNIKLIYSNKLVDIIDCDYQIRYISNSLLVILGLDTVEDATHLDSLDIYDEAALNNIKRLNKIVIEKRKPIRFISIGKPTDKHYTIFHEIKYPIINSAAEILGVFTLIKCAHAVHVEPNYRPSLQKITFNIGTDKFNALDELILFYSNIGFTQGEIHQSLLNKGYTFTINGFKYHYNQLLIKANATSIEEAINSIEVLKNRRFIPKALIQNNKQQVLL